MTRSTNSAKIGAQGEDFVVECLKISFPSDLGYQIYRTHQTGCGDIVLQLENKQKIMIEVKDISKGNVKSANKGNDINKFYKDSISTKLGYKFSGNTYSYCLNIIKN